MILLRFAERLIRFASFPILARLLRPDDYGLFAVALSVSAIAGLIGRWGFDSALTQRRDFDRRHYDTAWTLTIVIGAFVGVALCALAIPAARFFAEPRLAAPLYLIALANVVASFENIGTVDFLKKLDYRRELVYRLGVRLATTALAIGLAIAWRDYWALVAGQVAGALVTVVLSYAMSPYRPRFSLSEMRALVGFSRWVFVRNVVQGLNDHAANLIVGRLAGVAPLAFYTFARDLADVASTDLYGPIRRALFPAYAAAGGDAAHLRRLTIDSTAMMLVVGLPVSVGIAVVAADAVRVLLGNRWLDVVPLLQILALAGCVGARVSNAPILFVALGRPDVAAKLGVLRLALVVTFLVVGTSIGGTIGAAWATMAAAAVMGAVNWRFVSRALAISRQEMRGAAWRPFVAVTIMAVAVLAVLAAMPDSQSFASSLLRLSLAIGVGAASYVLALAIVWQTAGRPDGAERHVINALHAARMRPSPSTPSPSR